MLTRASNRRAQGKLVAQPGPPLLAGACATSPDLPTLHGATWTAPLGGDDTRVYVCIRAPTCTYSYTHAHTHVHTQRVRGKAFYYSYFQVIKDTVLFFPPSLASSSKYFNGKFMMRPFFLSLFFQKFHSPLTLIWGFLRNKHPSHCASSLAGGSQRPVSWHQRTCRATVLCPLRRRILCSMGICVVLWPRRTRGKESNERHLIHPPAGSLNVGTTGPWWMFMVFNFLRRWDFWLRVSKISISTLCSKTQRHCPLKVALLFSCSMAPALHPAGLESPWTFISDTKSRLLAEAVVTRSYQRPRPPRPCPSFLGGKLHLHFTLRSVEGSCSPLKPDPLLSDGLRSFRAVVLKLHQV